MLNERAVGGALWIGFGVLIAADALRFGLGSYGAPGPGFIACGAAILMALQGAVLLLEGIVAGRGSVKLPEAEHEQGPASWARQVVIVAAIFVYALLMPKLGFVLSSFLFLAGLLLGFPPRRWIESFLLAAATVLLSYLFFVTLLEMQMPAGLLGRG